jgi:cilia- and flagella-associated protein 65
MIELNKNPSASYRVRLLGTGYSPALEFVDKDRVVFRPTFTGTSSSREFVIKNISRLRVRYRWVISRKDANFVQTTPSEGWIDGNTIQNTVFTFTPQHKKTYRFRISCEVLTNNGDEIVQSRPLELVGEGSGGKIAISPECLEFGPVMIGSKVRRKISLYNSSDCTLQCRLFTRKINGDGTIEESSENDPRGKKSGVILPHAFGEVASCTTLEIPVIFRPSGRGNSKYRLYCHTSVVQKKEDTPRSSSRPRPSGIESMLPPARYAPKTTEPSPELKVDLSELPSILLSGDGENPHVEIVDLRVEDLSRALMWNMFSMNEWNEVLSMPVDPVEV